jgi:transposase-like protein
MLTVVPGDESGHEAGKDGSPSLIDEIVREGARRMLAQALQAEVDAYIAAHAAERDLDGRRLVVRNGYHQPREVFPEAREGRCWFHKTANVLAALPKSAHPGAKKALAEIWGAEDEDHARAGATFISGKLVERPAEDAQQEAA